MLRVKLVALALFAAFTAALLLTDNAANPHARAYSAGPPAGFTHAPGELDCADCHTAPAQSAGTLALGVPDKYTPGQTYDVTVTHASADPTRVRWGFQMTALDAADQKAGAFAPADDLTRVVNGEGPFPGREYVEHTSAGTFPGQQNGAGWTFKWTAPAEDVGPVTFYLAGNQANGDGNSSGDNIYFTFKSAGYQPPAPDFALTLTPSQRTVVRGQAATYEVTVTPLNGFTGTVTLSTSGLPAAAAADFQPASVNLTGGSPQTSVLTVSTTGSTTTGPNTFNVNAASGALSHAAQAGLGVAAATDADVYVSQSVSPNPAQANADVRYTVNVSNNGPAAATSVRLVVIMPPGFTNFAEGTNGDRCLLGPAGASVGYDCRFDGLPAGQSAVVDFTLRTPSAGVFNTTTTASAVEHDPFPSNNEVTLALNVAAQSASPSMTVSGLGVRTVVAGLDQPTTLAFVGADDFLVLERATGRVVRVKGGVAQGAVLDLAVNSASERGLLGIALHPNFSSNGFAYLYWTESSSGADTGAVDAVPLLGNRVDRFVWNGSALTFDRTLMRLRALQTDAGQPARGNHNGGVLRFGPDGKLYVFVGDVGRRSFFQNLPCGPTLACPGDAPVPDDQFGGPEPDDAHATGAIFRLNDDGTTPGDNPYAQIPTVQTTPVTENIKRVYAYGVRNSFGMDFDPVGGYLWTQENGDDAFDEINRVEAGFNGGWAQLMGPSSRIAEFKAIEVARGNSLQQNRWPPSNIADTAAQALARLYQLPGSKYTEPEFSWKYAVAPSPLGFGGAGLGADYAGDLFVGASRTTLLGGYLMRFDLSADRRQIATADSRLADKVADNADKFDLAESESLLVGRDFGVTTDLRTEPSKGTLYVVSLSNGAVYEVFSQSAVHFEVGGGEVSEGAIKKTVNVVRTGDTSRPARVGYETEGGTASERSDYTTARGTLDFAPGETSKSFEVLITDDGLDEPDETVGLLLREVPGGNAVGSPSQGSFRIVDNDPAGSSANPVDSTAFFVRQHYADFLNREPDPDGFQFWVNEIEKCGADAQCREVKRVNVSAAFFLSIEFQETGYFVYRIYDETFDPPPFKPFMEEVQGVGRGVVVGRPGWEQALAANRQSFADEFVTRPSFRGKYDALSNGQFVDSLYSAANVTPPAAERDALVAALDGHTKTRARVLIDVAENAEFKRAQFNRAFVLMQYYGYLRRNPNDPPDSNFDGFNFWLNKLNDFGGDYIRAEMVKAFISSDEYRKRFGP